MRFCLFVCLREENIFSWPNGTCRSGLFGVQIMYFTYHGDADKFLEKLKKKKVYHDNKLIL